MSHKEFVYDLIFKIVISILIIVFNCISVFRQINGVEMFGGKIMLGFSLVLGFIALCFNGAMAVRNYYHIKEEK